MEIQTKLKDSSDCTSDPQQRPRSYYFLRYGEEMAKSRVIGKKKRGRSETTEASLKGKQYRRIFLFHNFKLIQGEQFRSQGCDQLPLTIMSMINT